MSTIVLKSDISVTDDNAYNCVEESEGLFHAIPVNTVDISEHSYTCREEFANDWLDEGNESFLFEVKRKNQIAQIISMFAYIQKKLLLNQKNWIRFVKMKSDTVFGVMMGKWWSANEARRELMTALFRAALQKDKTNAEKIKNCAYLDDGDKNLRKAFDRFMAGYTRLSEDGKYIISDAGGWHDCFTIEGYEKILVKKYTEKALPGQTW